MKKLDDGTKEHVRQQALGMMLAYAKVKHGTKLFAGTTVGVATRRKKNKAAKNSRRINRKKG